MKKLYEHGIPDPEKDEQFYEFCMPYYATLNHGDLVSKDMSVEGVQQWGRVDYWTVTEAALLLSGILPDDPEFYMVYKSSKNEYGTVCTWKYDYEFRLARRYLFLLERSNLAPKAPPFEWVKYIFQKMYSPTEDSFDLLQCYDWVKFFDTELREINETEDSVSSSADNPRRREQQHEMILTAIAALNFDPLQIPDGGKTKIKTICLTRPRFFTDASFDHAWKAGLSAGHFRMASHEKYSSK